MKTIYNGFSKLTLEERENLLLSHDIITQSELELLKKESGLSLDLANHFVENLIGTYAIPLGVAMNFVIDGKDYIIPMAIEETSVIAAASKTAKWIRERGEIVTSSLGKLALGQIQIPHVTHFNDFNAKIMAAKDRLIDIVNKEVLAKIIERGGGLHDIQVRQIPRGDGRDMAVIHLLIDTCDAMGANMLNQACEHLKPIIQNMTDEKVGMCILSNLADSKITRAEIILRNIEPSLGKAIVEASLFANLDPYRAATNNKGVMNGMDAVLIATGNDWRAVEAAVHAYAGLHGYTSITRWDLQGKDLHGVLQAPILVGTVGGVTRLHPIAQICLKILGVKSASELARIVAAVGLVQNLGALRALVTAGITRGHMMLHIDNIAIASGANDNEIPKIKKQLLRKLKKTNMISESDAHHILDELRRK